MNLVKKYSVVNTLFSLLVTLLLSTQAWSQTFCDDALKISEEFGAELQPISHPQIHLRIYPEAAHTLQQRGLTGKDLEELIENSQVSSFMMGGKHVLPLFQTVKNENEYRDYVLLAVLREPFIKGTNSRVYVLTLGKVAEKEQKTLFYHLAEETGTRGQQVKARIPELAKDHGFQRAPIMINISPAVVAKLKYKHRIDMRLLESALSQKPDAIEHQNFGHDRYDLSFRGDGIKLLVVLAANDKKKNTTFLVTSYFTKKD